MLYFKDTPRKGRGVFSDVPIVQGDVIEECPILLLDEKDTLRIADTLLHDYYFGWPGKTDPRAALPLGFGMLYNHSYEPNASYEPDLGQKTFVFRALREIAAHEEICTNYNRDPSSREPLWFDAI